MEIERNVKLLVNGEKVQTRLTFKEIDYSTTKEIIVKNHYSHKWNTAFGKINIGVFKDNRLLGVASFGNLMNPKSYKSIGTKLEANQIIELNRLWVDDELGGNTETILLSCSWQIIRAIYPEIKLVQSFADGRLGCGTIYKAASFGYYGYTESLFFEDITNGVTYHKVPTENTKRPNGMIKLNVKWCQGHLRPFIVKTYRYIYKLDKKCEIDLKELPYPKYDKGLEYIDNFEYNVRNIIRAYALAQILGQYEDVKVLEDWLTYQYKGELDWESYYYECIYANDSIYELAKERNLIDKLYELCGV